MPVTKPTIVPRWATDANRTVQPPENGALVTSKDMGFLVSTRPPARFANWLFNNIYLWILWLQDLNNQDFTAGGVGAWNGGHSFKASISVEAPLASNQDAASFNGDGTGRGVSSVGGSSGGTGVYGAGGGGNSIGLEGYGTGTAPGGMILGGSNGAGLLLSAGGGNNPGLDCYSMGTAPAARFNAGLFLNGTQPAATVDPGANVLHATNILKAQGMVVTNGAGGYVLHDALNVASVTVAAGYIELNWAGNFANTHYSPVVSSWYTGVVFVVAAIDFGNQTAAKTRIYFRDVIGNTALDPQTTVITFTFVAGGRQ
jgi:hypothetical protein